MSDFTSSQHQPFDYTSFSSSIPPAFYDSEQDAVNGFFSAAREHRSGPQLARYDKDRGGLAWRRVLACSISDEKDTRHKDTRVARPMERKTAKIGCPFKTTAKLDRKTGKWHFITDIEIHNHGPLDKLNAEPTYRSKALTNEQRNKVILFAHQGDKPSDIAVKINAEDPDIELIPRDFTNLVHKKIF